MALVVNDPPANARDLRDAGSIPGSGRPPAGRHSEEGLSWCPVVKNLPPNAGVMGLIPGRGTKIPHATRNLNLERRLCATTKTQHHQK